MLARLRVLRGTEIRLLLLALLFFAAGYVLVVTVMRSADVVLSVSGILDILWPSVLPFMLFLGISVAMSWRAERADQLLLPLVAMLTGLGLMVIARLEPSLNALYPGTYEGVDTKQSLWVTLGVVVLGVVVFVPWDDILRRTLRTSLMSFLSHQRYTWLGLGLLLVVLTFFLGVDPNDSGVRAWFRLGPVLFQPSELLKIILVIFLASYLDDHRELVARGYRLGPITLPPLPYLIPLLGMWGICMGLIIFQRDLGAGLMLFSVFLAMLYVATSSSLYVIGGLTAFAIGSYVLYQFISIVQLRVGIWLNPWETAYGSGYQIIQAIYALASGGVLGTGLGRGSPATVSAAHTDFIFSAIGEEMGLAGTLAVLVTYLLLVFRGYHIALSVPGRFRGFEQLLAVGLTTILAVQTFIIVGGNLRLIPLTGITLPFISYGGSSIIINFMIIGLLLRISAGDRNT